MKRTVLHLVIFLALSTLVRADSTIQSVQQALKNQKVYYGKITGEKNAETIAAIRRYQIRSGLQVTGEVNSDTLRSLNINPNSAGSTQPSKIAAAQSNSVHTDGPSKPGQNSSSELSGEALKSNQNSFSRSLIEPDYQLETNPDYAAVYYRPARTLMNKRLLATEVQRQLVARGYYRGSVDGRYGRQTALALRAFQFNSGLPPTGRLATTTLNALGVSDQNIASVESALGPNQTWIPLTKYKHGKWKVKWKKYQRDEADEYGDADRGENGRGWWNVVGQDE